MININLIPLERRKKGFPIYKLYIIIIYSILAITLLLWSYNLFMFKYSESKLSKVQGHLSEMHLWQERYNLNQVQNSDISNRENIVKNLKKSRMLWSESLAELGNITPYGCWLTSVSQAADKSNKITIEGNALKMEQLLTFIANLQKDPKITDVSLVGTQTTKATGKSGVDIIKFTISINKNGGGTDAK